MLPFVVAQQANAEAGTIQRAIDASQGFTCAIRQNDIAYCSGQNDKSQLGFSSLVPISDPTAVPGLGPVESVTTGSKHACAVGVDGYGYCWGDDSLGQLGTTVSGSQAKRIDLNKKLIDLQAGADYSCALTVDLVVYCWGNLTSNQAYSYNSPVPVQIAGLTSVTAIVVGDRDVCVLTQTLRCWGSITNSISAVEVPNTQDVTSVTVGLDFLCFIKQEIANCLGDNTQGQLGRGNLTSSSEVQPVLGLSSVSKVFAGGQSACAVGVSGSTFCWGNNDNKQVSITSGDQVNRVPSVFPNGISFAVSSSHICALNRDSSIGCVGDNSLSQSGIITSTEVPTGSATNNSILRISTGATQTCAITTSYKLRCWGNIIPDVDPEKQFREVAVGNVSVCAIDMTNKVLCWGSNSAGQLGDNTNKTSLVPVEVQGIPYGAISVKAGYRHFCALAEDRLVYCWGDNLKDQLGYTGTDSKIAVVVPGIASVRSITLGDYHSCLLTLNYRPYCWGDNSKKQIQNSATQKLPLTELAAGNSTELAAGGNNTCFILGDFADSGKLTCMGDNSEAQATGLIAGTYEKVSVSGNSVCANRLSDSKLVCFGSNVSTKLGRTGLKSAIPSEVPGQSRGTVSVGLQHTCYVGPDSALVCWGSNTYGQLASSFGFPKAFRNPTISIAGKANIGEPLKATVTSSNVTNFSYQWYRYLAPTFANGSAIQDAKTDTLILGATELNRRVGIGVVVAKWGATSEEFVSPQTAIVGSPVRLLITPTPVISGKAKVGSILRATTGRWDVGANLTIQWYRGTVAIKGATKSTYKLLPGDAGKQISVYVTGVKVGLPKVVMKSNKTAKVVR